MRPQATEQRTIHTNPKYYIPFHDSHESSFVHAHLLKTQSQANCVGRGGKRNIRMLFEGAGIISL